MAILAVDEVWLREPRLLVPRMQPVGPLRINWSNPITKSLRFCCVMPRLVDLVSGRTGTMGTRNSWSGGALVASGTGTDAEFEIYGGLIGDLTSWSSLFVGSLSGLTTRGALWAVGDEIGVGQGYSDSSALWGSGTTTNGMGYAYETGTSGTFIAGTEFVMSNRFYVQAFSAWKNGRNVILNGSGAGTRTSTSTKLHLLGTSASVNNLGPSSGSIKLCAVWGRQLSDAENISLNFDPFQIVSSA